MKTLGLQGRRMVVFGAVLLMAWAVYELSVRFEEMVTWVSPVHALVQKGKLTWLDYFTELDWSRLSTHAFLAACVLFGLFALVFRKGLFSAILAAALAITLIIISLGSTNLMDTSLWQKIKLIPLALIGAGSLLRMACTGNRKTGPRTY